MLHIYTVCYNTPELVRYQYLLLHKYIKGEFKYHVFNNTCTEYPLTQYHARLHSALMSVISDYGLSWFDVPVRIFAAHDSEPSTRAGIAIDYATRTLLDTTGITEGDIMFLLDADAFPIAPFDVNLFMEGVLFSGREQIRKDLAGTDIRYITNQIVLFRPRELEHKDMLKYISFAPRNINGALCDCGGSIYHLFNAGISFKNWSNGLFSDKGNYCQKYGGSPDKPEHFTDPIHVVSQCNGDKFALQRYIEQDTLVLGRKYPFCEIFTPTSTDRDSMPMFIHQRAGTNWIRFDIDKRNHVLRTYLENIKKEEPSIRTHVTEGLDALD